MFPPLPKPRSALAAQMQWPLGRRGVPAILSAGAAPAALARLAPVEAAEDAKDECEECVRSV